MNLFSVHESYQLSTEHYITNKINDKLYVKAVTLEGQLPAKIEADREIKLGLSKDTFLQHTIDIKTPGKQFIAPADMRIETAGVTFSRDYKSENETLYIDYILKIDEPSVSLTEARDVIELADKVAEEIVLNVFPQNAAQKLSRRLGLKTDVPSEIETELNSITALVQKKENVEAMERLNVLETNYTKENSLRGYIQFYRGAVLIDLKRKQAAITAFDEACLLYTSPSPRDS